MTAAAVLLVRAVNCLADASEQSQIGTSIGDKGTFVAEELPQNFA